MAELLQPSSGSGGADSLTALIAALAMEIDSLFTRYQLSDDEGEDLLREILLLAIYRWDTLDSREIWFLSTLRRACLRRLRRRANGAVS
jgi:DNA-directed RNA polymerase specialized sigma24 family protein